MRITTSTLTDTTRIALAGYCCAAAVAHTSTSTGTTSIRRFEPLRIVVNSRICFVKSGLDDNAATDRTLFHELLHYGAASFL